MKKIVTSLLLGTLTLIHASETLTIVAHIEAKRGKIELVRSELLKLIEPTRQANGCIQYDLHQDNERPEIFLFFENWEDKALWKKNLDSDHIKAFMKMTDGALVGMKVEQMSKVE